jgi:hypothetical protein
LAILKSKHHKGSRHAYYVDVWLDPATNDCWIHYHDNHCPRGLSYLWPLEKEKIEEKRIDTAIEALALVYESKFIFDHIIY